MQNDKYLKEYDYKDIPLVMIEKEKSCEGCFFMTSKFVCFQDSYMLPDCAGHIFITKPNEESSTK